MGTASRVAGAGSETGGATFLQGADYYLVAQALAGGHTVVTHEIAGNSLKRIKIPDACLQLGVHCINPFTMLRTEGAEFVLGPAA